MSGRVVLLFLLLACAGAGSFAQTTAAASASGNIPASMRISITGANIAFGTVTDIDMDAGYAQAATTTVISHRANVRHSVSISTVSPTFTGTNSDPAYPNDPARTDKPAGDLFWSLNGFASAGTALSTASVPVIANSPRGRYDSAATVTYRILLSYSDSPGDYSISLTYTIAAS